MAENLVSLDEQKVGLMETLMVEMKAHLLAGMLVELWAVWMGVLTDMAMAASRADLKACWKVDQLAKRSPHI